MRHSTGVMLAALAAAMWSAIGLVLRLLEGANTWQVLFWRSLGMVPVLLVVIAWRARGDLARRMAGIGPAGVIGGLGLCAAFAGGVYALQATSVATAAFLFSCGPIFAAVLGGLILHERVARATWAAIALAGVGIGVMVADGLEAGALAGNIAAILSALGFASFTIALRWDRREDMMPTIVLGGLFSMLVAGAVLGLTGGSLAVSPHDAVLSMAMGAVLLAVGLAIYTLGARVVPAVELSLINMIEVLLAPVWVWVFLNETASRNTLIGGAILLGALLLNTMAGARTMQAAR